MSTFNNDKMLFSTKSTIAQPAFIPQHLRHIDYVRQIDGKLVNLREMLPVERLFYRRNPLYSLIIDRSPIEFNFRFDVHGRAIHAKLTALLAVDAKNCETFIRKFYTDDRRERVTAQDVELKLHAVVESIVRQNLLFTDTRLLGTSQLIRSTHRHQLLVDECSKWGLHLFIDDLITY